MSASCCGQTAETHSRDGFRRVLWAVLAINAGMFAVEVVAGLAAGSASLQADALDFLGDAGNYVISLAVVGMALRYRAMAAFAKGATMGLAPARLEDAFGMDLHAQRCARQPRGAARGTRRVRHRHRVARYRCRRHHGEPRLARRLDRSRSIMDRDTGVGAPTGGIGVGIRPRLWRGCATRSAGCRRCGNSRARRRCRCARAAGRRASFYRHR